MGHSFYDLLKDAAFAGGGGGSPAPAPVLIEKSVTGNGTYTAADDEADGYSAVTVNVPNTYTQADEGKVVSNGVLVSQGSDTVTENGTVDTTLISSLLVKVQGGGTDICPLTESTGSTRDVDAFVVNSSARTFIFGRCKKSSSTVIIFNYDNSAFTPLATNVTNGRYVVLSGTSNGVVTAESGTNPFDTINGTISLRLSASGLGTTADYLFIVELD